MERNRRGRPRHPDVLTPAEWRVLDALREGGTNAEIASRLGLSADTVKYHISNMLAKLELRDRRALASWRPEERRGRLSALFTVPAFVWAVARPIAWVGAGTAAVAGVVVGVVAVVALVAVVLVTAGGDADPPLTVAPPLQTSTPSPPTPTGTPSPTPTPTPTATPPPTLTATPTPTPVQATLPLPTREELGIREVDAAEAFAAAGLTHVRYEAGEEVPWDPGLFLLDTVSGAVEGWVRSLGSIPEEQWRLPYPPDIAISPSNRFLQLPGALYDRQSGRAHRIDGEIAGWWGYGSDERLLVWVSRLDAYVTLDGELEPTARFQLPPGELLTRPLGGYIVVRPGHQIGPLHLVNLEDETNPQVHTWELPWDPVSNPGGGLVYRIDLLDGLVAFVGRLSDSTCRITRYDLRATMLSDQPIPCGFARRDWWVSTSLPRISPDGSMIAVATFDGFAEFPYGPEQVGAVLSVFDATTGAEAARVLGAHPAWIRRALDPSGDVWLADSSGLIVETRDGLRVASLTGRWDPSPGWAAPDDPQLFRDHTSATNIRGDRQVSISFGSPSAALPDPPADVGSRFFWEDVDWGARSDTVRVRTSVQYVQYLGGYSGTPPLEAVIEFPPFSDEFRVEVVVDTCLNVREGTSLDTPVVTCLPNGTIAETDDFWHDWLSDRRSTWMHIRTDDGVEGWAHADYLRWHSDGVRLEE